MFPNLKCKLIQTLRKKLDHLVYAKCSNAMFFRNIKMKARGSCLVFLEKGHMIPCPHLLTSRVRIWTVKGFIWNLVRVYLHCNQWDCGWGKTKAIWKKYFSCSCHPCIFKVMLILECLQDSLYQKEMSAPEY